MILKELETSYGKKPIESIEDGEIGPDITPAQSDSWSLQKLCQH